MVPMGYRSGNFRLIPHFLSFCSERRRSFEVMTDWYRYFQMSLFRRTMQMMKLVLRSEFFPRYRIEKILLHPLKQNLGDG